MKLIDMLKLSWGNVVQYKKRSAMIMVVIVALIGVVLSLNVLFCGAERVILEAATAADEGEVYIMTGFIPRFFGVNENYKFEMPENDQAILEKRVRAYNGDPLGKMRMYEFDWSVVVDAERGIVNSRTERCFVADPKTMVRFIKEDLNKVPNDKIPVLVAQGEETDIDVQRFVVVGEYPRRRAKLTGLSGGWTPINMVLENVSRYDGHLLSGEYIMIDSGAEVRKYIEEKIEQNKVNQEEVHGEKVRAVPPSIFEYEVAKFASARKAGEYAARMSEDAPKYGYSFDYEHDYVYSTVDLFGNTVSTAVAFHAASFYLMMVEMLLLIVSVCIVAMTFLHVVGEETSTIALYRVMGARTRDIWCIYLLYLLELCLIAMILCALVAVVVAAVATLVSAPGLAEMLRMNYGLADLPTIWLFGADGWTLVILGSVLLIAPMVLLLSGGGVLRKNIAGAVKNEM